MTGRLPEHRVVRPVNLQDWAALTFLHWPVDPAVVRRRLPPGLDVDVLDGSAWLGVVPFVMRHVRVPGTPPPPGWDDFPECNVRTYVRDRHGRTGVWFFRLVCPRRSFVAAMRTVGLPYACAAASVDHLPGGAVEYRVAGLGDRSRVPLVCTTHPGDVLPDDERVGLVDALTGRWAAWSRVGGQLLHVPVEHEVWPLHRADVDLGALPDVVGLDLPDVAPLVHFSPGVHSRFALPGRG